MEIKLLIPNVYFFYTNLVIMNMTDNYYDKSGILIDSNNLESLIFVLNGIRLINKDVWSNYIKAGINLADVLDYSLEYVKKYKDKRLINWRTRTPRAINYDYLIYLLFMMGDNDKNVLADVSYNSFEEALTMEIRSKL